MILDPQRLFDRSIEDLTQLAALLAAGIRENDPLGSPELRACEESVVTIRNLLPRLQVARNARITPIRAVACMNCDD